MNTLDKIDLALPNHYRGKVRDNYELPDGRRVIIASDRLSAFDRPICSIPEKGCILTTTSRFWFEQTADICPNHVLDYPDPNVLIAQNLEILPVEIVVRDYLAGTTATSILQMYKSGRRKLYGIDFPDGLLDNASLPWTMITPTTKSDVHDEPITPKQIMERGLMTDDQWMQIESYALNLFAHGRKVAHEAGLILADTKYEFGVDPDGNIILADEIHTPDSSRYWFAGSYFAGGTPQSFDKDRIRSWISERCDPYTDDLPDIPAELIKATTATYIDACCRITGNEYAPYHGHEPIIERIKRNLFAAGIL